MRRLSLLGLIFCTLLCNAQQQTRHWFLSQNHISVTPSGVTTGLSQPAFTSFNVTNKSTSISDAAGNLLFAFDGTKIIDRNLNVMPSLANVNLNGQGNRMLIQQLPGSYLFYVFYTARNEPWNINNSSYHLKYAIVDLTLNSGNGDVVAYDLSVTDNSSPSFTIVQGDNPLDLWLITHRFATDSFYSYKITTGGLTEPPVASKAGTVATTQDYIFYDLKASFDGKMIAGIAYRNYSTIFALTYGFTEVFDIDAVTGKITSKVRTRRTSGYFSTSFSLELSPDNRLLYTCQVSRIYGLQPCGYASGSVYQYNPCYTDSVDFQRYGMQVAQAFYFCAPNASWSYMQMGADKRLHLPFSGTTVSTINFPNRMGASCDYVFQSYQLPNGNFSTVATPDFTHEMMQKAVINNIVYEGGCYPNPIHFRITNDTITRAEWNFGDPASGSNTSSSLTPSHIFSGPGKYTVTAQLYNSTNQLIETVKEIVEIADPGTRVLNGYPKDTSFCSGEKLTIKLNVVNGIHNWYRTLPDGTRYGYIAADSMQISSSGTWYVEMRQNDCNGCIKLDSITVTVLPKPSFDLGSNRNLCLGDSLLLGQFNPAGTYIWNTGDNDPSLWIKQGGLYWAESEINNNGCPFRDSIIITGVPSVNFSLPADTTLCNDEKILLNPGVTNASYIWQDGSSNSAFQVTKAGEYWVRINSSNGCTKSDTIVVSYINAQQVDLGNDTTLCNGNALLLNTTIANAAYQWSTGETTDQISVTQPGEYWIKVDNGNCTVSDTVIVAFNQSPVLFLGADTTICQNEKLLLDPGITNASYSWQNGSQGNSFTVSQPGLYWLEVNQLSCIVSDTIVVTYFNVPPISLGPDIRFCAGDSATLQATPGFRQYNWNGVAGSNQLVVHTPGSYEITGFTADGCKARDTLIVQDFYPLPNVDLGSSTDICFGQKLVLNAGTGYSQYSWSNGSTSQTITVDAVGSYSVEVINQDGCHGYDTILIRSILSSPAKFLPADTAICSYGDLLLKPNSSFNQYQWSTGGTTSSITVTQPGVYWLKVRDQNNCTGSDTVIVRPKECLQGFFIPTAFSPNNDGKNDMFYPLLFGNIGYYRFTVYNRWGQIVFNSVTPGQGWNGKYQGQLQDSNVYIWSCSYQLAGEPQKTEKGTVSLIR